MRGMYLHAERLLAKAGVASARRGGSPTLKWSGRAKGCTSGARKPGETPCARGGQRPRAYFALALRNRPEKWSTAKRDGNGHSMFAETRRWCMPGKRVVSWIKVCSSWRATRRKRCQSRTCVAR